MLLGGKISVDSTLEQGTCFTVIIPFKKTDMAIPEETAEESAVLDMGKNVRCLLVDDDRLQLELTASLMKRYNFSCVCCEHPKEVLGLLSDQKFDFVFTDIQMPELSGFELVRLIRASDLPEVRSIPVVALTARSNMSDNEFLSAGFTSHLNKPFTGKELYDLVVRYYPDYISDLYTEETVHNPEEELRFSALLAFAGDDKDAANEILASFVSETRQNLERFKSARQDKDMSTISAVSHKLIPLFTLLEHRECTDILIELEKIKGEFNFEIDQKCQLVETYIVNTISEAERYITLHN